MEDTILTAPIAEVRRRHPGCFETLIGQARAYRDQTIPSQYCRFPIGDCRLIDPGIRNRKSAIGNPSFVSKRNHRIDLCRSSSRDVTSEQCHRAKQQRDGGKGSGIGGANAEQKGRDHPRESE